MLLTTPGLDLQMVAHRMFVGADNFSLMAIPFFVLAGDIMAHGGISTRFVKAISLFVGHLKSGLGMVAVGTCMLFAGVTGASVADTAAVGSVMIPAMIQKGYGKSYAGALLAAGGTIGPIIPPSIPFVIYGVMADVSIAKLFLSGIVPGILIGIGLMIVNYFYVRKNPAIVTQKRVSFKQGAKDLLESVWALITPLIILGGILGGIFTATESAAIAVVYALLVGFFVYKELKVKDLFKIFLDSAITSAAIMFLIAIASLTGWLMTFEQIPIMVANAFLSISHSNPLIVLLLIDLILFLIGFVMDYAASLIILGPVFIPLILKLGIDPVFFGALMIVALAIGLITPPVGICLYVGCGIAGVTLEQISRKAIPMVMAMLAVLLLMTFYPGIATFIPNMFK